MSGDEENEGGEYAVFKLTLPLDPTVSDDLHLAVSYRNVVVQVAFAASELDDLLALSRSLSQQQTFTQCVHEFTAHKEAFGLDSEIENLLGGDE